MADTAMTEVVVPSLEEIQNMKVMDLRKKLREFGLPTVGNKVELVERLQEACLASKGDSFDSAQLSFDESHISELDGTEDSAAMEDSALLDQDQFSPYISSLDDDPKVLNSTENKSNAISNSVTMPLKKRKTAVVRAVVEKKLSLNRTNIIHIDFDTKPTQPKIMIADSKSESDPKISLSIKNLSSNERMAMRAKRFNFSNATAATNTNKSTNNRNSKQSIISSNLKPDLDVLKKRAERFGQSVSTVMKQIEHKEKLLKRKCKFGASISVSASSNLDEQAKKRKRAERFGIS